MKQRFDSSPRIGQLLTMLSSTMAVYRGLPMMAGAGLVLLSCVLTGIFIPLIIMLGELTWWWLLLCAPLILLQLGVITALVGLMMSEPLGRGYKE